MSDSDDNEVDCKVSTDTRDYVQSNGTDSDFDELDIPDSVAVSKISDNPISLENNEKVATGNWKNMFCSVYTDHTRLLFIFQQIELFPLVLYIILQLKLNLYIEIFLYLVLILKYKLYTTKEA